MNKPTKRSKTSIRSGWFVILLVSLAILDLRTDLLLLKDHFTLTTLQFAIRYHLLAVVVLMASGSLWKRYR